MYFSNKILQKCSRHCCIIYMQFTVLTLPGSHFQEKSFVLCLGKAEPGESQSNKLVNNKIIRAQSGDKLPRYSWLQPSVQPRLMMALFFQAIQQTELPALKIQLLGRYGLGWMLIVSTKKPSRSYFWRNTTAPIRAASVKELSDFRLVTIGSVLHQDSLTGPWQTEIMYAMMQRRAILNCLFS